jgi:hypothetical protein
MKGSHGKASEAKRHFTLDLAVGAQVMLMMQSYALDHVVPISYCV